ncbi:flavodoxin [Ruminococcus albus]|uniref:Putative lipoprotein n=1 Tax=Ruminococcus albus 8 TaxID=246199 RepID=E9SCL8_RUMAL|nr:flavodoxin [Ruminococcus albus]EGC02975.1 putative lipoprotein [Ruminococcus albus 8]MCC3351448.1 NAD(P)H-dependent oxidoreductase [Ruminococcus albus 8]
MKKMIAVIVSALFMALGMTACGSGEPASAPSVAENDKAAVQEKLNRQDSKTDETKADDKQSDESTVTTQADTETPTESDGKNILVAYFSRADENYNVGTIDVGNTQIVAEYIASEVGADSFHIETVTPYPADYDECCDVAKQELADKARPEIQGGVENMEQYDIVFLGYPIWWGDMPMAVYTFMDSCDFSDKVVIPFNTHEGSGESGTYSAIASYLPNAQVLDGMAIQGKTAQKFSSDTQQAVRDWLDGLGF